MTLLFPVPGSARRPAAVAPTPLTYLFPAPRDAVVFAPFILAESQGYYARHGLKVTFVVVPGGIKVGQALSRGEGDLGGALGDTPIMLRDQGYAIRGVALLGGHSFLTLMTNRRRGALPCNLGGGRFGVPSMADVSAYVLTALVAKCGLSPDDVAIAAMPPPQLWDQLGKGQLDGIVGTVDWGVRAQRGGVALDYAAADRFFPAMAQAILASDNAIRSHPCRIRAFVQATLEAVAAIRRDPAGSARAYRRAMPGSDLSLAEITTIFSLLARHVYGDQRVPGAFDRRTVAAMQRAYLDRQLVTRWRAPGSYYTNLFTR